MASTSKRASPPLRQFPIVDPDGRPTNEFFAFCQFMFNQLSPQVVQQQTGARWYSGTGSPLGVVAGNIGDLYTRTDGGAATTLYVKESGTGASTGWVAK